MTVTTLQKTTITNAGPPVCLHMTRLFHKRRIPIIPRATKGNGDITISISPHIQNCCFLCKPIKRKTVALPYNNGAN